MTGLGPRIGYTILFITACLILIVTCVAFAYVTAQILLSLIQILGLSSGTTL